MYDRDTGFERSEERWRRGSTIAIGRLVIVLTPLVAFLVIASLLWMTRMRRSAALRRRRYWIYDEGRPVGPLTYDEVVTRTAPDSFVRFGDIWVGRAEHPDFGR